MSTKFKQQYTDPRGAMWEKPGVGIMMAAGITKPTDGTIGYANGCIFIDQDASAGATLFINEGTITSCDFNSILGVVTEAELALLSGILATAAEINRVAKVSTNVISHTTSSLAVTELLHSGKIIVLNLAAGIAVTLPVASAGLHFRFIIGTTFTGAATIKSASGADIMVGHATMGNDSTNATVDWQALTANTFDTIDMFGTANSTGGFEGQEIEIIGLAANKWFVRIQGDAAGTEATPFQDTVA